MKSFLFWALIVSACVVLAPVVFFIMAIFPAVCPAEWEAAKNGGF